LLVKFNLDISAMLTIHADNNSDEKYVNADAFNVSVFYLSKDDCEMILRAEPNNISGIANRVIRDVLIKITNIAKQGEECSANESIINRIYSIIEDSAYTFVKPIKRLSKSSANRKYKAEVEMILSAEYGELWRLSIYEKKLKKKLSSHIMNSESGSLDRHQMYHHACWEENIFRVYNRLNQEMFTVEL